MSTAMMKVCKVCGIDVSAAKRLRNAQAEYFCQSCAERLQSSLVIPPAPPSSSKPPSQPVVGPATAPNVNNAISTESVTSLRPGEYDCFYDDVMISLLRRQVEPEALLMACGVRRPQGQCQRTILLTPTRLLFVGVNDQQGQRMIVDRRELSIAEIDQISATVKPAGMFSKQAFLIQLATREGIEGWLTEYSSGRSIADAVQAIKQGESVAPFIRRIEDMEAVTVSGPPSQTTPASTQVRMPAWAGRFILPQLRTTQNPLLVAGIFVAAVCVLAPAVLAGFLGALLICFGDSKEFGTLFLMLVFGVGLAAPTYPNVVFALERLLKWRRGQAGAISPAPAIPPAPSRVTFSKPRRPIPWAMLTQTILPAIVIGGVGWWSYSYYQASQDKLNPPMPKITVIGNGASAVTLTDWKLDFRELSGVVRFNGQTGVELHYKVTNSGVVQDTGVIDPPIGGSLIITHDPLQVSVLLPSRPTENTEVEITAFGG